jgi:hypothetical protein
MTFPLFDPAYIQTLINNSLLEQIKGGPGAPPFNPVPFQLEQMRIQQNHSFGVPPVPSVPPVNPVQRPKF